MVNWPTWELTHVHRQQGVNNSIVDNAHRILKGLRPISDSPKPLKLKDKESAIDTLKWMLSDKDWRFAMIEVDEARSEERGVGKECGRTCRTRGSPYQ